MEIKPSISVKGLNLDAVDYQREQGFLTWAMNANVHSHDGNQFTYTNEPSNQLCFDLTAVRPGFKVVGHLNILEQNRLILFITHPDGRSEIGQVTNYNKDCLSSDPTEVDCGCHKGVIITDTVSSSGACCDYEAILTDDCCSSCDEDCYYYRVFPLGDFGTNRIIRYKDCCTGEELEDNVDYNVFVKALRGTLRTTSYPARIEEVQKAPSNCGCNPSPESCCLNFSIDSPIYARYKTTACGTNIYFVSRKNPMRYLTLENPLGDDACGQTEKCLSRNCSDLKLFPETCHPNITPTILTSGGSLKAGTYQFAIAYADRYGNELTDYFDLTNPVSIFERKITHDTDYITSKSIRLNVEHSTDVFDFYNIVVAQTVNTTTLYYLIETRRVLDEVFTYTGNHKQEYSDVRSLLRTPFYETANIIENSNDILFLGDLETSPEYNLQPLCNEIVLRWETVEMPADKPEFNYANGIISSHFRSYMRDEVYPFGIKFKLKNGKYTRVFHIPGRAALGPDLATLNPDDRDVFNSASNCPPEDPVPTWKVYNTAEEFNFSELCTSGEYVDQTLKTEFDCEINPHKFGGFAYWESTQKYPCNPDIWGQLADTPVRFHKFPDCKINHHHDKDGQEIVYPIGVRVQKSIFDTLLNEFPIYNPKTKTNDLRLKDLICGFEIVRGNRVGNKSVIAKGLVYDVCKFTEKDNLSNSYYYPNYPYNDHRPDPFLSISPSIYERADASTELEDDLRQIPFPGNNRTRLTFHSPDTHFQFPKIGTELKLESSEYGSWKGHFVPVADHPRYKFITKFDLLISAFVGTLTSIDVHNSSEDHATVTGGFVNVGGTDFNISQALSNTAIFKDLLEKAIPKVNYAWQYNSIADYTNSKFPNKGNIRRKLDLSAYLSPNNQFVGDDLPIHNYQRESSVYLKINSNFLSVAGVPADNSRNKLSDINGWCDNPTQEQTGAVSANYCSVKRDFPDQYGPIENVSYVDTGAFHSVRDVGGQAEMLCKYYPIFGGDTFINKFALKRKMPFFTQNMVKRPDQVDFDYWLVPNTAFPTYFLGTSPDTITIKELFQGGTGGSIIAGLGALLLANVLPANAAAVSRVANIVGYILLALGGTSLLIKTLSAFIAKNNLDCDKNFVFGEDIFSIGSGGPINPATILDDIKFLNNPLSDLDEGNYFYQDGKFYLASYGIPNFYVESDVNVDMRHGRNPEEENFYPNVGQNIPDDWLQEKNVPILHDNHYNYNFTYSKQNYENYNQPYNDFKPDELCESYLPNRVIYSDPTDREEKKDSWRIFRTNNYFDFPKTNGKLIGINSIENDKVITRFENLTSLYNSRIILDSSHPIQMEVGTGSIFANKPIDLVKAETGYLGSQNKAFITTKYGSFWVDAKRGFVHNLSPQGVQEISKTNFSWFKRNLPFSILEDFPTYDIDNAYKGVGISLGWDERYERLFLTKLDYKLIPEYKNVVVLEGTKFRNLVTTLEVELGDPAYFENKSFTISYSPLLKNWISFYSFLPNAYVSLTNHFQTITHSGVYNHLLSPLSYQNFYGEIQPYIIEYPLSFSPQIAQIHSVTLIQDIQKFYNLTDYYSLNSTDNEINFNKAIIYNKEQSSGVLNLIHKSPNDLSKTGYPKMNVNSLDVLYTQRESKYTFNGFTDLAAHNTGQPLFSSTWSSIMNEYPTDKVPNLKTLTYTTRMGASMPLRGKECRVRLIQDKYDRFRFTNHFLLTEINQSTI